MKDNAQTEMELIMNEQQDPVSGNTAPIGAKPSEVRDDIDVRVSEGEFIINLSQAHESKILEDTIVLEVKNGPYFGPEKDRTRIEKK